MSKRNIWVLLGSLALLLGACQPAEPEVREVEVTREVSVEVEVPVEVEVLVEVAVEEFPEGTELRILMWSHFVEQYDRWFDPFAKAWGGRERCQGNRGPH